MKIRLFFLLMGLVILVGGCGQPTASGGADANNPVKNPSTSTAAQDCGSDEACFDAKFKACAPAKITYAINAQISQSYKILGFKNGRCELKTMFPKNILPDLMNKEGYCLYNNTVSFKEASQEIIALGTSFDKYCHGPLYDAIRDMSAVK